VRAVSLIDRSATARTECRALPSAIGLFEQQLCKMRSI
jgi:hypothetical protein